MPIRTDTVWLQPVVNDTINGTVNDSVTFPLNPMAVEIPISQHIYDGKGYKAWVSGYAAKLDSLWLERTEVEQTIFIKEKRSRWGLSVSAGTAITPRGFEPYIGAGLSYTFI
ncbi:MAG: hypothetical protein K2L93_00780, partial [Muribaculaceae bacterium]|nr:hypothetical protein [Muribaculaceae bacterium]